MEHPTDMCPILQETESNNVECIGAIDGYQYATIPVESDSRAVYRLEIWARPKPIGSEPGQLSATDSEILGTIILPTTAIIGSTTGQVTFNGRVDEANE
ncbi:hypothetical protein CR513_33391, partial [Mucuna pruriens]